jgi:acetyltransferase-like isoleucine patch superfamily enzyme
LEKGFKNLIIEDDVHIGTHCLLDLEGRIFLKKGVTLSPQVTILTHSDAGSQHHSPLCECFKPVIADVTIETYCWIGCRVTLLAGSHVRQKTVVGACSLVKGALDSCALYAGIPARKVRTLPFENF